MSRLVIVRRKVKRRFPICREERAVAKASLNRATSGGQ